MHSLEKKTRDIGLHVNLDIKMLMRFKQDDVISALSDKPVK